MSKRGALIVAGVVLVAAALVGAQLFLTHRPSQLSKPSSSSTSHTSLRVYPPVPESNLPTLRLTAPPAPGAPLARLADAPGATVSGLKIGTVTEGTTYRVRMRPFGYGPSGPYGSRVVIHVEAAKAPNGGAVDSHMVNANLIALMDTQQGGTILTGGMYDATIAFYSDGRIMVPVLSRAKPAN